MGTFEQGTLVALALFAVGLVYHAGRASARLESLESWRRDVNDKITSIRDALDRLERKVPLRCRADVREDE